MELFKASKNKLIIKNLEIKFASKFYYGGFLIG